MPYSDEKTYTCISYTRTIKKLLSLRDQKISVNLHINFHGGKNKIDVKGGGGSSESMYQWAKGYRGKREKIRSGKDGKGEKERERGRNQERET